jgi:hypothetical protein
MLIRPMMVPRRPKTIERAVSDETEVLFSLYSSQDLLSREVQRRIYGSQSK